MRDLRDAVRRWARTPVITVVVVLSLALGIGANTAIFSLIDALLLKSLPVRDAARLVRVSEPNGSTHGVPVFREIAATGVFDSTAAMSLLRPDISTTPERRSAFGLAVNGGFFDTLGVAPAIGRLLTPEDDAPGTPAVAVTDYEFWQNEYGGRPDILGATIKLDGTPFTIVGVTERGFFGLNLGRRFDVAIALNGYRTLYPHAIDSLTNSFSIIARLRPEQSVSEAEAQVRALQPAIRARLQMPDHLRRWLQPVTVSSIAGGLSAVPRDLYRQPLTVLMALVALVLMIACANVANLMLARSAERRGELAVRMALGASRRSILGAVMMESLVIAGAGSIGAILIGTWMSRAIVNALAYNQSGALSTWIAVPLDLRVFAFTGAAGVLTAVLFGVAPAWRATRVQPLDALRRRGRGILSGGGRLGAPQWLVALQVALTFVLVFGGGLLIRSFLEVTTQDLGFDREDIVVAVPDFGRSAVARRERVPVSDRIRDRLRGVAGVQDVGFAESTPFGLGTAGVPFAVGGGHPGHELITLNRISDRYFRTMGIAIKAGRDFDAISREPTQSAIVNEAFARRYFGGRMPLGETLRLGLRGRPQVEIVGVSEDTRYLSLRDPVPPTLYLPFIPEDEPWIELDIRSQVPPRELQSAVLHVISDLAPGASVEFRSVRLGVHYAASRDRVIAWLAGGFAALALLLSAIGLYGVMSHHVLRRRQEFGVRVAIGAAPSSVTRLVLRQAAVVIAIGLAIGLGGALASGRALTALLYNVTPQDPFSMAATAFVLTAITVIAALIPARRASHVDPMVALRDE